MPTPTTLQGRIYDAQENPLANVIVHAMDQDLRTAKLLGNSEPTDSKGFYKITFPQERAALAELKTADISTVHVVCWGSRSLSSIRQQNLRSTSKSAAARPRASLSLMRWWRKSIP